MREVFKKFLLIVLGYAVFALGGELGFRFHLLVVKPWQIQMAQKRIERFLDEQKQIMLADTLGGTTPLETIELFRQALQQGDIEKALKYFSFGERPKQKERFLKMKQENTLAAFVANTLEHIKEYEMYDSLSYYTCANEKKELSCSMALGKLEENNLWIITNF